MAAHTKIIDLFGIPACGKTTLANYICENYSDDIRVTTIPNMVKEAKKERRRLLFANPLRNVIAATYLRMKAPFEKKRKDVAIWGWPSHDKYYAYAKKYSDYEFVLADHGDIQSIVTLERGDDLHLDKKFLELCLRYLENSMADIYVYCKVETEVSLERMHKRCRERGRIDLLSEEVQRKALDEEKQRFDFFFNILSKRGYNVVELDMDDETSVIAENLLHLLNL